MWHFRGNVYGTVESIRQSLPMTIESFTLVNKGGSSVTVNVYMVGDNTVCVAPFNQSLAVGSMYENERQIVMLATEQIRVQTSGSIDYDFTINNIDIP